MEQENIKEIEDKDICKRNLKAEMYVLSLQDIQRIENCTYSKAVKTFNTMNYFRINNKPYVLASEYFCKEFIVDDVAMYQPLGEGLDTKVVKLLPPVFTVRDVAAVFDCGIKHANEIMSVIPKQFKINNTKYVAAEDFKNWLKTLPNKQILVGEYARIHKTKK